MFENMTYDYLLARMLSKVPDSMDKREGSIIYDAIAPVAVELAEAYIQLETVLNESFADTQTRPYLIRRVAERGITPYKATRAILRAVFTPADINIPMGARFSCEELNYTVTGKIENGTYTVECESYGVIGNEYLGTLIPINYISGLQTARLTEVLIPGEDDENTEDLRQRYFDSFDTQAYGGNIADYKKKTNAIEGVGATKVTPVWQGGGTVLLTILDSKYNPASDVLIDKVQTLINPHFDQSGVGISPIGHLTTVRTADVVEINVSAKFQLADGYTFEMIESKVREIISDYLLSLRSEWAKNKNTVVRVLMIETELINNIEAIVDITDTTVNGESKNLTLGEYEVPVLGGVVNE